VTVNSCSFHVDDGVVSGTYDAQTFTPTASSLTITDTPRASSARSSEWPRATRFW
jgi:hypothetical protein